MTAPHDTESDRFMISLDDSRAIAATLAGLADPIRLQILQLQVPDAQRAGEQELQNLQAGDAGTKARKK